MRVLIDTNVIVDVLAVRQPHFDDSAAVFQAVVDNRIGGLVGATSITTVFYLVAKERDKTIARKAVEGLLDIFDVAPITEAVLRNAIGDQKVTDYEDAVLSAAAINAGVDAIVTRDSDFSKSPIRVYNPGELIASLDAGGE